MWRGTVARQYGLSHVDLSASNRARSSITVTRSGPSMTYHRSYLITHLLGNSEARSRLVILLWLPLLQAFYHAFYESSPRIESLDGSVVRFISHRFLPLTTV